MKKFLYLGMFLAFFGGFGTKIHSLNTNHNNNLHNANNNNNNNSNSIDNTQYDSKTSYKDLVNSKIKSMEKTDSISQKTSKVLVDNWDEKNMLSYSYDIIYGGYNSDGTYTNNIKYTASGYTNQNYVLGENNPNIKGRNGAYVASSDITNLKVHLNYNYQPTAKVIIYAKYLQLIKLQALSSYKNPQKIWYSIDATGILTCPKITLNEHLIGDDGKEQKFAIGYFNIYNFYNTNGSWSITLMSILAPPILLKTALTLSSLVGTSVMCGMCFWCKLLEITEDYTINASILNKFDKNSTLDFHNSTEVGDDVINEKNNVSDDDEIIHNDKNNSGLLKNDTKITPIYDSTNDMEEATSSLKFQDSYQVELIEVCYFSEWEREPVLGMENDKASTKITKPNSKEEQIKSLKNNDTQETTDSYQTSVEDARSNLQQEWAFQDELQKASEDEYLSRISFEQNSNNEWQKWYEKNEELEQKAEELRKNESIRSTNYKFAETNRIRMANQEISRINEELLAAHEEFVKKISKYQQKIQNEYDLKEELRIQMENEREHFFMSKSLIQERLQIQQAPKNHREFLKDKFECHRQQAIAYFNETQEALKEKYENNKLKFIKNNNIKEDYRNTKIAQLIQEHNDLMEASNKITIANNEQHELFLQKIFLRKLHNIRLPEEAQEEDLLEINDLIAIENNWLTYNEIEKKSISGSIANTRKAINKEFDAIFRQCHELDEKLSKLSKDNEKTVNKRNDLRSEYESILEHYSKLELSMDNDFDDLNKEKLQYANYSFDDKWKSLQTRSKNLIETWKQKVNDYDSLSIKIRVLCNDFALKNIRNQYIKIQHIGEDVRAFKDEIIARESTEKKPIFYRNIDDDYIEKLKTKWFNEFYRENPEYTLFRNRTDRSLTEYLDENENDILAEDNNNTNPNFHRLYEAEEKLRWKFNLMKKMKEEIIILNDYRKHFVLINQFQREDLISSQVNGADIFNDDDVYDTNLLNNWTVSKSGFAPKSLLTQTMNQHASFIKRFQNEWVKILLNGFSNTMTDEQVFAPNSLKALIINQHADFINHYSYYERVRMLLEDRCPNMIIDDLMLADDDHYYAPCINDIIQIIDVCSDKVILGLEEFHHNFELIQNEFLELINDPHFSSSEYAKTIDDEFRIFTIESQNGIINNLNITLFTYNKWIAECNRWYRKSFDIRNCEEIKYDLDINNFYLLKNKIIKVLKNFDILLNIKANFLNNHCYLLLYRYDELLDRYQSLLEEKSKITNSFENGEISDRYDIICNELSYVKEELIKIGNIENNIKVRKEFILNWMHHKWSNEYNRFVFMLTKDLESEINVLNIEIKNTIDNEELLIRLKTLERERDDLERIRSFAYDLMIIQYVKLDDATRYVAIKMKSINESMPVLFPDIG